MQRLKEFPIVLPPVAEQRRIVENVRELMAFCDKLERSLANREKRRERLVAATLHGLSNGELSAESGEGMSFQETARFYFNHLPRFTTRPEHIQQLRRTVLDLSMRGSFGASFPQDEPVPELLKRVARERSNSTEVGETTALPGEYIAAGDQNLHSIPCHWRWVRLGEIITFGPQNGVSPRESKDARSVRSLTLTATTSGRFDPSHYKYVDLRECDCRNYWLRSGDVLFQRGNTRDYVGIAAIYHGPDKHFIFPDLMIRVRFSHLLDLKFLHWQLVSPRLRTYFAQNATGASSTMPKINQKVLLNTPIVIPPIQEQRRIDGQIRKIMALCGELEINLKTSMQARAVLLEATLQEALGRTEIAKAVGWEA